MISFKIDSRYEQDLKDDVIMNENKKLYEFIGKDPVKAFYLGCNLEDWFSDLDKKQCYLYSKDARHNKDDLEKYQNQVQYWINEFSSPEEEINLVEMAEFIMNNMIWYPDTEELDKIKLAFFFGNMIRRQCKKEEEKL